MLYATMYQGALRCLNRRWLCVYDTRAGAIAESRRYTHVSVVEIDPATLDLGQCSVNDTWPADVPYPKGKTFSEYRDEASH